jgi:hypothetical protein
MVRGGRDQVAVGGADGRSETHVHPLILAVGGWKQAKYAVPKYYSTEDCLVINYMLPTFHKKRQKAGPCIFGNWPFFSTKMGVCTSRSAQVDSV